MDRRSEPAAGKGLTLPVFAGMIAAVIVAGSVHARDHDWRRDQPCGERHSAMAAVEIKGCHRAWCADTALGRLCACVGDAQTQLYLERAPGSRKAWDAPFIPPMGGETAHFRIDSVGKGRLLFAMMASESVGIAISTWAVWALDADRISRPLEVQNYGTISFATTARAGNACTLLAARWHPGWEPRRGHGMYIAGSWYAIEGGEFSRVEERPAISRRYLFAVERSRYDAEERGRPLLWHRGTGAVAGPRPVTGKAL